MWEALGSAVANRLEQSPGKPIWVNSHGVDVVWCHIRLDPEPGAYHYVTYKSWPHRAQDPLQAAVSVPQTWSAGVGRSSIRPFPTSAEAAMSSSLRFPSPEEAPED